MIKTVNKQEDDTSHDFKRTKSQILRDEQIKDWKKEVEEYLTENKENNDSSEI